MKWILFILTLPGIAFCSDYWVSTTGSDAADGSYATPWLHIQHGATNLLTGDTLHVLAGTFDERITPSISGTAGNLLTFVTTNGAVVRGFNFTSKSYIAVIGFEITHPSTNYNYAGVLLTSANNCQVLDCYVHHVNGIGIDIHNFNTFGNTNVIRGNTVSFIGMCQTNVGVSQATTGIICCGTNNLCEYNDISYVGDFFAVNGFQNIIRNNYLHDIGPPAVNTSLHVDGMEQSPTASTLSCARTLFERNYAYSNLLANSHGLLLRCATVGKSVSAITVRHNALDYFGSAFMVCTVPLCRTYNNTLSRMQQLTGNTYVISMSDDSAASATNGSYLNNLYYNCASNAGTIYLNSLTNLAGSTTNDFDLRYLSGTSFAPSEPNGLAADPILTNGLHINVASPCVGAARWQTVTSSASTSNVVAVVDAGFFCDGWGIVTGDSILVSGNSAATLTNADYDNNLLYFASNLTWTNNAPVYLAGTVDIGALPYGSINLIAATLVQNGTTYTVTPVGDCRGVWFYVNGIPTIWDSSSPYTATLSGTVTAKAYALYAQANPVTNAIYPSPKKKLSLFY